MGHWGIDLHLSKKVNVEELKSLDEVILPSGIAPRKLNLHEIDSEKPVYCEQMFGGDVSEGDSGRIRDMVPPMPATKASW